MAYLGTPYRVVYAAKNLATGLSGITAKVLKPNGSVAGSFALSAVPGGASFAGLYYFDLITSGSDPAGEWVGILESGSEGIRRPFRVSFEENRWEDVLSSLNNLESKSTGVSVVGSVDILEQLTAQVESMNVTARVFDPELHAIAVGTDVESETGSEEISGQVF